MRVTQRVLALTAVGLIGVGGQLHAQTVNFQGNTTGCFIPAGGVTCSPGSPVWDGDFLKFTGTSFNTTSFNGVTGFSLGTLALSPWLPWLSGDDSYNGDSFLLNVFFSSPSGTGTPTIFTAALKGAVHFDFPDQPQGGAWLVFDGPQVFNYQTAQSSGTFALTVDNASLQAGHTTDITGNIQVSATPEPATTALMATGLLGLVPMYRMRRKKSEV